MDVHQGVGVDVGVIARRLGTVRAIFRTTARLDREEDADLHLARVVVCPMHAAGAGDEVEQGRVVNIADVLKRGDHV